MNRSAFQMIKYMNGSVCFCFVLLLLFFFVVVFFKGKVYDGSVFSKASYMNGSVFFQRSSR